VATFITLLQIPILYAIFVRDLKLVKWEEVEHREPSENVLPPLAVAGASTGE
jgi:hypothetical protein